MWKRYFAGIRALGVLIILGLVAVVGYQVYYFYSERVMGATSLKTIETYFGALGQGNYQEVYRLTSKAYLTDIYGRPITEGEFIEQLKSLTGGHKLPFGRIEATKLFEREGSRYYLVKLYSTVGGKTATSRILVELRTEGNIWVVVYPFAIMLRGG